MFLGFGISENCSQILTRFSWVRIEKLEGWAAQWLRILTQNAWGPLWKARMAALGCKPSSVGVEWRQVSGSCWPAGEADPDFRSVTTYLKPIRQRAIEEGTWHPAPNSACLYICVNLHAHMHVLYTPHKRRKDKQEVLTRSGLLWLWHQTNQDTVNGVWGIS